MEKSECQHWYGSFYHKNHHGFFVTQRQAMDYYEPGDTLFDFCPKCGQRLTPEDAPFKIGDTVWFLDPGDIGIRARSAKIIKAEVRYVKKHSYSEYDSDEEGFFFNYYLSLSVEGEDVLGDYPDPILFPSKEALIEYYGNILK